MPFTYGDRELTPAEAFDFYERFQPGKTLEIDSLVRSGRLDSSEAPAYRLEETRRAHAALPPEWREPEPSPDWRKQISHGDVRGGSPGARRRLLETGMVSPEQYEADSSRDERDDDIATYANDADFYDYINERQSRPPGNHDQRDYTDPRLRAIANLDDNNGAPEWTDANIATDEETYVPGETTYID